MKTQHRLASLLTAAAVAVTSTALVTGHAATLQVDSAKVDTFEASQPAPTSTTIPPAGDTRAPQLTALEMFDTEPVPDGRVDQVVATFDEALPPYTAGTAPWTLSNVPSGGTLASVQVTGTTATLAITEGTGTPDTAVGLFAVALAQSATGIRDAAGNQSSFASTAPADKARPMPLSMSITNGGGAGTATGRAERGDTVTIVWSERLQASSICSSQTSDTADWTRNGNANSGYKVVISNNGGAAPPANDVLSTGSFGCDTFRFGAVDLGSQSFVSATSEFGSNANNDPTLRSEARWLPSTRTFILRLGAAPQAGPTTNPGSVTATYTPATGLKDPAGNAATGAVSVTAVQF